MAELELAEEETEFKDLVDKIGETAGGGVRLIIRGQRKTSDS